MEGRRGTHGRVGEKEKAGPGAREIGASKPAAFPYLERLSLKFFLVKGQCNLYLVRTRGNVVLESAAAKALVTYLYCYREKCQGQPRKELGPLLPGAVCGA